MRQELDLQEVTVAVEEKEDEPEQQETARCKGEGGSEASAGSDSVEKRVSDAPPDAVAGGTVDFGGR